MWTVFGFNSSHIYIVSLLLGKLNFVYILYSIFFRIFFFLLQEFGINFLAIKAIINVRPLSHTFGRKFPIYFVLHCESRNKGDTISQHIIC